MENNRFDRLDLIEGVIEGYKNHSVTILVSDNEADSLAIQVMALIASNLLSRWCRRVNVNVRKTECKIPNFQSQQFHNVLMEQSKKTPCDFTINCAEGGFDSTLLIGNHIQSSMAKATWIGCSGWLGGNGVGTMPQIDYSKNTSNILGAAFAACLGVSQIFRCANGAKKEEFSTWYSLFDFTKADYNASLSNPDNFPESLNLGTVHQIGAGAVGSSFLYLLALTNWTVDMCLIDYDEVQIHNCPTSLIFSDVDAENNIKKIDACQSFLQNTGITLKPFDSDYKVFINDGKYSQDLPDAILCFANEKNIWLDIQQALPPLTYHSTTTKNWGINFGRHIPLKEWCIVCRFESELNHHMTAKCAEGDINANPGIDKEILGMLPFLPSVAAILVLADLAKTASQDYPLNENFIQFSMKTNNGSFLKYQNYPKPCFACEDYDETIYPIRVKRTKYWNLSA